MSQYYDEIFRRSMLELPLRDVYFDRLLLIDEGYIAKNICQIILVYTIFHLTHTNE